METLVERCLWRLYFQKIDEEAAELLRARFGTEMKRFEFMVVDGRMYNRYEVSPTQVTPTYEQWETSYANGDCKIRVEYKSGKCISRRFLTDGVLYRWRGPALQEFHENGMPKLARWENPESCAALIPWEMAWDKHGNKRHEVWTHCEANPHSHRMQGRVLHREGGPAVTVWHPNGKVRRVEWWKHGKPSMSQGIKHHALSYHEDGSADWENTEYSETSIYPALLWVDGMEACRLLRGACNTWFWHRGIID